MAADHELTEAFTALRPLLLRVGYATLGSITEAEDVVQEAWLRLHRVADPDEIRDLRAWLTQVVARLSLDALRSARHRREQYIGQWLPEPIITTPDATDQAADPGDRVTLDESVTMALLIVLEQLTPAERTAFVCHDVFGMPFDAVAKVVGRTPTAVRQLAARARRHVNDASPPQPASREEHRQLVDAFTIACASGDLDALVATLTDQSSGAATAAAGCRRSANRYMDANGSPRRYSGSPAALHAPPPSRSSTAGPDSRSATPTTPSPS